jgi:predicted neuraminidase
MRPAPDSGKPASSEGGLFSRRSWLRRAGAGVGMALMARRVHGADNPAGASAVREPSPGELRREFIYERAEFPSCHASTIVEIQDGLMAAWFGGEAEGRDDVSIYTSRFSGGRWSPPEKVAEGLMPGDDRRYPCWNPVLFQPAEGPLLLFYKVGPRPHSWWGMVMSSADQGRTWSKPKRLPDGIMGPVRAKPIQLADGTLLCGSSTEDAGWRVQMEFTRDPFGEWSRTPPLNTAEEWGAIQPTLLQHSDRRIQILCRSRQQSVLEAWSEDAGRTWSPLVRTPLPNPSSGIDAARLKDGRFILIYNHLPRGREMLNAAITSEGRTWEAAAVLEQEPGEFSYPAVIVSRDGLVHVTYTWKRRLIRHVVLDPARLRTRPIIEGRWPS